MAEIHEALLMDYAAGSLDRAHSVLVASYLTLSPQARRTVAECETLGAAMMAFAGDCTPVGENSLRAVLDKIDAGETPEPGPSSCAYPCIQGCAPLPQPLLQVLPASAGVPKTWRQAFGGLEWLDLIFNDSQSRLQVIRCRPGFRLPRHAHRGPEITLVLDGAFRDDTGYYQRGDLVIMDHETRHQPEADLQNGCLLVSVTSHPIRFTGFFTRFLNPFV